MKAKKFVFWSERIKLLGKTNAIVPLDLYLKNNGTIAFVLPRSLFSADQHDRLRRGDFKIGEDAKLHWREIWDCENVTPLFNVPSCVLIADKGKTAKIEYPASGQILSGKLERKSVV